MIAVRIALNYPERGRKMGFLLDSIIVIRVIVVGDNVILRYAG